MIENLTSRKFIIALLSIIVTAALMWFGKIGDGVYSTIMISTVGAYLTANVIQKKETSQTIVS